MSAGSDNRAFDSDGTQAPPPPMTFDDPVSGIAGNRGVAGSQDLAIAQPIKPDPDVVNEMVRAAMAAEGQIPAQAGPADAPAATPRPATPVLPAAEQPGVVLPQMQRQRTWPARSQQLMRQRLRGARQSAPQKFAKFTKPTKAMPASSRTSAGVALAVVLLVLFVVIAFQLVSSVASGISGLFG